MVGWWEEEKERRSEGEGERERRSAARQKAFRQSPQQVRHHRKRTRERVSGPNGGS